jgi:PAS domain S-box-containing protein
MSEKLRTEDALRRSEERLRFALEAANEGLWDWNLVSGEMYLSPRFYTMLGFEPGDFEASFESWCDQLHPDDRPEVLERLESVRCQGGDCTYEAEFRRRTKEGAWRWILCRCRVFERGAEGQAFRIVGIHIDITETRRVEAALRESEERYRMLIEGQGEGIGIVDEQERFTFVNPAAGRIFGLSAEEMIGRSLKDFVESDQWELILAQTGSRRAGQQNTYEMEFSRADGEKRILLVTATPRVDGQGRYLGAFGIFRDITERRKLEEELRQAHKMESIGRLAGGIAHDFNNLLSPIIINADLALLEEDVHGQRFEDFKKIRAAALRAKELTQQLLAFGRKQVLRIRVLNINQTINESQEMLRRLIREDVEINVDLDLALDNVKADPTQIQQILMNLALNARDSMPEGGTIRIETRNVQLAEADARTYPDLQPGRFVMLGVSDSGRGMDRETLSHIFEPFFSTKELAKGTGLGLSTVHGIVKQHGGHIRVESEPGVGTSFKIYLPRVDEVVVPEASPLAEIQSRRYDATVLVAEDDDAVRRQVCRILTQFGFQVIEAKDGDEALLEAERHDGQIDLLLTDVIMPVMNGRDLYDRLSASRPNTQVVYMSGYADEVIAGEGLLSESVVYLQKPFSVQELMDKIRAALER